MGYDINIKLSDNISEEIIDGIVEAFPREYLVGGKQQWGWSCSSDMRLEDERTIRVSGSCGMSGQTVDRFIVFLIQQLTKKGYFVQIGKWSI